MSFEMNKVFGSILFAMIIFMVSGLIAEGVVNPKPLTKPAFPIAAAASSATPAETAAPAVAEKPAPLPVEMLAKADAAAGEATAKKCAVCHSFGKGEAAKVGPNLWGIIGDKRAHMAGFNYSDAMQKLGGTWTVQEIGAFIAGPQAYLPGTRMSFPGLPKPEDRANVLAYLNKDSDSPVDMAKAGAEK